MTIVTPIPVFGPINAVTPFTYRDNDTFQTQLRGLRDKVNEFIAQLELVDASLRSDLGAEILDLTNQLNMELTTLNDLLVDGSAASNTTITTAITDFDQRLTDMFATSNLGLDERVTTVETTLDERIITVENDLASVLIPTVLLVGDSITAQSGTPNVVNTQDAYSARGFFCWANWLMGERFNIVASRGIGGETSVGLAARISNELTNYPSEWVVVETTTNDIAQGRTFAQITASMTTILDAIASSHRRCCVLTTWPSNGHSTLVMQRLAGQVAQWIAALPLTRPGIVVVDPYSNLVDPATGMLPASMTFDGVVHPGSAAAYRVGLLVANAMKPFVPTTPNMRRANTDALAAISNAGFLTAGLGWALSTGTIPTYPRDPESFSNLAICTVAPTGAKWSYTENVGPRVNIGDTIQARCRIRWSGFTWSSTAQDFAPFLTLLARADNTTTSGTTGEVGYEPTAMRTTFSGDDVGTSGDVIVTTTKLLIPTISADATAITGIMVRPGFRSTNLSGGTVTISGLSVFKV